jgi:hypothetical protein
MRALQDVGKIVPKGSVMSIPLARVYDMTFVTGLPADIKRLEAADETKARRRRLSEHLPPQATPEMRSWVENGDVGASSAAIFFKMTGWHANPRMKDVDAEPRDAADLLRCVQLLEAVPAFAGRISEMAEVSPGWKQLAENWDRLMNALDDDRAQRNAPGVNHWGSKTAAILEDVWAKSAAGPN